MANQIQIKRSNTSANAANTLLAGELAYSYNTNSLFIGAQTGISATNIRVGGEKYNYLDRVTPGTLTANAAYITDANAFISNVYTTGLVIQASAASPTSQLISSISNTANGSVLGANSSGGGISTELATTAAIVQYVSGRTGAAVGSNGQFLFNNSGVVTGSANFTYDYTSNTLTVGNSSVNVQLGYVGGNNQLAHFHGNANSYVQVQVQNINIGASSSADLIINADNATDSTNYVDLGINGSNWSNTQWTINGADDGYLYSANGTMAIGTASAKAVQFFSNGTLSTNEAMRIDAGANVGIGNTNPNARLQVTGTANVSGATRIGGTLAVDGITTHNANIVLGTSMISANGSYGSAGQVMYSDGSKQYWATPAAGVTGANQQIQFNDSGAAGASAGLLFDKTLNNLTVSNTIYSGANSYIGPTTHFVGNSTVNTSITAGSVTVNGVPLITNTTAYSTFAQNTSVYSTFAQNTSVYSTFAQNTSVYSTFAQNTSVYSTFAQIAANTSFTGNNTFGGTTTTINSNVVIGAANIDATSAYLRVRDVAVSGNLTITGTLTTIDTTSLQVKDSMIKLADQNTGTDLLELGIYGVSGNTSATYYSGIYRDHSASTLTSPVFKIFSSNVEPTTIVDNTAPAYALGTLNAYLTSGAFVANSTAVNITANATISSAIVANSLTLTTALAAAYGGTGQSSYTAGDLLYASGTTTLSKLSVPGSVANGQVLQIVNNLPAYSTLDGGTF